jgi:hypothetical protein
MRSKREEAVAQGRSKMRPEVAMPITCTCTCFLSMGVLVPVLPQYLAGGLGQGFDMVGLAVTVPGVTAILARPPVGRTRRPARSPAG